MADRPRDRFAADRMQSARLRTTQDRAIETAVLAAMTAWLDAARVAVVAGARNMMPGLSASGYDNSSYAVEEATQSYRVWRDQLDNRILPAIGIAFGEGFNQVRKSAEFSPYRAQQDYLATVSDRLKIWPEGAFEELRPELLEALSEAETYDQMTDRVGRILGIDAPTRALRSRIRFYEDLIQNPETDPAKLPEYKQRYRDLWREHDESLGEWQWKARRIARTEAHGAIQGGKLAAAKAREIATGDKVYKRWLSTEDNRVRLSHRVADGQTVPIAAPFRVGGFLLQHPADPIEIAPHETINCRCDCMYYDGDALQDALQGPDGSMGEVRPGGIRMGPDDPTAAEAAIEALSAQTSRPTRVQPGTRGEDHGQTIPADPEVIDLQPEEDRALPGLTDVDLTSATDDQLIAWLEQAHRDDDERLYERVDAELERRLNADDF